MEAILGLRGADEEFPRLVEFAEEFAGRCGLPDTERARVLIILEELFTNAVRYGLRERASAGWIRVALAARPGRIEIEFSDDGEAFDPLARSMPDLDQAADQRAVGGLGLFILRSLVDEARYRREDGRNHLALVRRLPCAG
jgi:anti-sigma regulatory factor (Ser/Thr protein kinase)